MLEIIALKHVLHYKKQTSKIMHQTFMQWISQIFATTNRELEKNQRNRRKTSAKHKNQKIYHRQHKKSNVSFFLGQHFFPSAFPRFPLLSV